ncbi:MAG: hypothetical protein ACYDC8_08660 [Gammaproteobacteria bacterium]
MNWISEAFASSADKARLIAIVISAVIAIVVLLFNQHFATKRARKEILIKKIEEAYQAALAYERHAKKLLSAIYTGGSDERGNFRLDKSLVDAMNEEVEKIEMILGLHFPSVPFNKEQYYAGPTLPVLEIAVKKKRVTEQESLEAAASTEDNVLSNTARIKALCTGLMKKHHH